jgi:hypothetical protein
VEVRSQTGTVQSVEGQGSNAASSTSIMVETRRKSNFGEDEIHLGWVVSIRCGRDRKEDDVTIAKNVPFYPLHAANVMRRVQ